MAFIVKVIAVAVVGTFLCIIVGKYQPELALALAIVTGVTLLVYAMGVFSGVIDLIKEIAEKAGISSAILGPLLKTTAIAIMTRLTSDICQDAGRGAIATAVDMAGTAAALYVAMPLLRTVFQMIEELI